jgi:hypothetical protein
MTSAPSAGCMHTSLRPVHSQMSGDVRFFARLWRRITGPPLCMFHQFSSETCFCFQSTSSSSDANSLLRMRYKNAHTSKSYQTPPLEIEMKECRRRASTVTFTPQHFHSRRDKFIAKDALPLFITTAPMWHNRNILTYISLKK